MSFNNSPDSTISATKKPLGKRAQGIAESKKRKEEKELKEIQDSLRLENFPKNFLGMPEIYGWQRQVFNALQFKGSRVCLKAGNESGKTSVVAVTCILWALLRFPGGVIVHTAAVHRQVHDQLWPELRRRVGLLGGEALGWRITDDECSYDHPLEMGGRAVCTGFSTNDEGKFQGYHGRGPGKNLMMIVDEGAAVVEPIFDAIERCNPDRLLVMSSPKGRYGKFYKIWTKEQQHWELVTASQFDCPHISKERIDTVIAMRGKDDPLVRSMVFAEFMETGDEICAVPLGIIENCLANPPTYVKGERVAFFDFAAGGDENVIACVDGNMTLPIKHWVDKDTTRSCARFMMEARKLDLKPENCYGDEGGMGRVMCDNLRDAGFNLQRVNNGSPASLDEHYANRGTEIWHEARITIDKCEVILPEDEVFKQQASTRWMEADKRGRLKLESKEDMSGKNRNLGSPDRADAVLAAIYFSRQRTRRTEGQGMAKKGFGAEQAENEEQENLARLLPGAYVSR